MKKSIFTFVILAFANISTAATLNFNGSLQVLDINGALIDTTDTNVTGWFDYDFSSGIGNGGEFNSGSDLLGSPWQMNNVTM